MRRQKQWKVREDYRTYLYKVKKLFPTVLAHVLPERIFLCSFGSRRSRIVAKIRRNRAPWSLLNEKYDYAIEFWEYRFDRGSEEYKLFVALHELCHIPQGGQDQRSKHYRKLVRHDLEEFKFLVQLYGLHLENVKDVLKGEKALLQGKIKRFPRTLEIK